MFGDADEPVTPWQFEQTCSASTRPATSGLPRLRQSDGKEAHGRPRSARRAPTSPAPRATSMRPPHCCVGLASCSARPVTTATPLAASSSTKRRPRRYRPARRMPCLPTRPRAYSASALSPLATAATRKGVVAAQKLYGSANSYLGRAASPRGGARRRRADLKFRSREHVGRCRTQLTFASTSNSRVPVCVTGPQHWLDGVPRRRSRRRARS